MKVAIIDDEVHCIESLVLHLHDLFPELTVAYKSNKAYEAIEKLKEASVDLLFMDIEMPGMNGFQLLEHFPDRNFDVIFTTAYSQYALQAFKARAVSYLLKPIDEEELKEEVILWLQEKEKEEYAPSDNIDKLLAFLKREGLLKSKISVPVTDGFEFVEVNEIMYCKSQSNYTTLHFINGNKLLISKTMKEVEHTLAPFFFIRVHQSYLINPNFMKKYSRNDGGFLIMEDKASIPVSTSKRSLIVNLFEAIRKSS